MTFEWDEAKNKINQAKHGISFEEAQSVFEDAYAILFDDPDHSEEEERFLIHALFFDERSERELEEMMGVHRMTIHNRKIRILQKLKKMLR